MKSSNRNYPKQNASKSDRDRPIWSHLIDGLAWILWVLIYLPLVGFFKIILILAEVSPIPFKRLTSKKDKIAAFILCSVSFIILLTHFFIPGTQNFEATLLVSHIQFTTPEPNSRFLLQNIDDLTSLSLQTSSETLTLRGTFTSPENPQINSILSQKTELSFTFSEANSHLLLYPSTAQGLAIDRLALNSTTQVNLSHLSYPPETQLNLGLNFPTNESPQKPAILQLKLNPELFILVLENIKIEGLEDSITELQFTPNVPLNPELALFSSSQLSLNFRENMQTEPEWIGRNLPVTDVSLKWIDRVGDSRNDFPHSSILKGEVRMNDKTLTIQDNQFLTTADAQDIEKLRYFDLNCDPVGLQVRLAGKSKKLTVGLDPDYPVQTLNSSWLSRYLSPDQITAALSFAAAVIGFLLPYLFVTLPENDPKVPPNP